MIGLRKAMEERYLNFCGFGSGRRFTDLMLNSVDPGGTFLDGGCGEAELARQLPRSVRYIGLDRYVGPQTAEYDQWHMRPNILGDVESLPIAAGSCDTVALLHVLEHVSLPDRVFLEVERVLRRGGSLFVDVPFIHELHHAPHDYFRYTPFALVSLAERAGLDVVEIRPSGGYFRALSHILEEAPRIFSSGKLSSTLARLLVGHPLRLFGRIINLLQYPLDLLDEEVKFTCGYHCIFRKPSELAVERSGGTSNEAPSQ